MTVLRHLQSFAVAALLLIVPLSDVARAALWRTEAELTAQYGEPVDIRRTFGPRTFTWQSGNLLVEVQFLNGKANDVVYRHKDRTWPFADEALAKLLDDNSAGKAWRSIGETRWELGAPAVADATSISAEQTGFSANGTQSQETSHWLQITSKERAPESAWFTGTVATVTRFLSGGEKRVTGVLELKHEEDDHIVAVLRQRDVVLEIPWAWRGYAGKAQLRAGATYEATIREEDPVDLDRVSVFVSDRVHTSHGARVVDSDGWFTLVRLREGLSVIYDEAVCEVHHTRMQWKSAEVGYGMYAPATKADAFCDEHYPHHADWIRGGCVTGDVTTAFHYVCRECVAATEKYKREHPETVRPSLP